MKVLKTQDKGEVRQKFLDMIHRLLLQVPFHLLLVNLLKNRNKMCLLQTEAFLMHPTLTSTGGFRISINGITILQVTSISFVIVICAMRMSLNLNLNEFHQVLQDYGQLQSEWDMVDSAAHLLRKFQLFANKASSFAYKFFPFAKKVFHWQIKFFFL